MIKEYLSSISVHIRSIPSCLSKENRKQRHQLRKELKKEGRSILRKHYTMFVLLLLIASLLGTAYSSSTTGFKELNTSIISTEVVDNGSTIIKDGSSELNSEYTPSVHIGPLEIGRTEGVFAGMVNRIASGNLLLTIQKTAATIFHSQSIGMAIVIFLAFITIASGWVFGVNIYKVTYRRIFLEARIYNKVSISRLTHLLHIRKWTHASITLLVASIYQTLWQLTIIGQVKTYSYFAIPYIIAENPALSIRETITLSRRIMNGHKWEAFMLDLSFFGWDLLGASTYGLINLLYAAPYREATYSSYYAYLRKCAIENRIQGYEELNDCYLFEKADPALIQAAYQDVIDLMKEPVPEYIPRKGIWGFLENNFGFVLTQDAHEKEYRKIKLREHQIALVKLAMSQKAYPRRLNPIPEKEKISRLEYTQYYRHYCLSSLILIFFIISFIGWCWEVSLHLIEEGRFVNRGVLFGPWLPIYGSGGILILLLLNRLKEHPARLFTGTIVLCGFVEYYTSYFMEKIYGLKWWDYSGYFLNINGRICAEGLLVFALGGFAIVYFLAPLLDNWLTKIPKKYMIPLCGTLLISFGADMIHSSKDPNTGNGITDYNTSMIVREVDKR